MTNALAGTVHQEMSETSPGADATSSPATGWTLGKITAGNYAHLDAQTKLTTAALDTTAKPGTVMNTGAGAGNALRTTDPYSGDFASGNWVFNFVMIATVGGASVRIQFRIWRSANADGSGGTDISGVDQQTPNLALSTTANNRTLTVNPGAFTLTNEYLFVTVAVAISSQGGSNTCDGLFRVGTTSTRIVSANFTPSAGPPAGLLVQRRGPKPVRQFLENARYGR